MEILMAIIISATAGLAAYHITRAANAVCEIRDMLKAAAKKL